MKKFLLGFVMFLMAAGTCFAVDFGDAVKADVSDAVASNARFYTIRLVPGTDVVKELHTFVPRRLRPWPIHTLICPAFGTGGSVWRYPA